MTKYCIGAVLFLFLSFILWMNEARASLDSIRQAWNNGDQAAVQQDFDRSRPREMAEIGAIVSGRLNVLKSAKIDLSQENLPPLVIAKVDIDGQKHIWLLETCADSDKFCAFHHREARGFGHAEGMQAADAASTLYGLAGGAAELNPAGLWVIPFKAGMVAYNRSVSQTYGECVAFRTSMDIFGLAPAVMNLLGGMSPITLGIGALTAWARFEPAANEAMFDCADIYLEKENG